MKIVIGGFIILLVAAIAIVALNSIFNDMITSACEKERLDQMSQYCYERLIKSD